MFGQRWKLNALFHARFVAECGRLFLRFYNPSETGDVLLFSFIEMLLPSTEGDLMAQARASEMLLWSAGGVSLLFSLWRSQRETSESQ